MAGYRAVLGCRGAFADQYSVTDSAVIVRLYGVMTWTTHRSCPPQMLQQVLLWRTAGLDSHKALADARRGEAERPQCCSLPTAQPAVLTNTLCKTPNG